MNLRILEFLLLFYNFLTKFLAKKMVGKKKMIYPMSVSLSYRLRCFEKAFISLSGYFVGPVSLKAMFPQITIKAFQIFRKAKVFQVPTKAEIEIFPRKYHLRLDREACYNINQALQFQLS